MAREHRMARQAARTMVLLVGLVLSMAMACAQDDDAGPCGRPTDKKVLKLLDDADRTHDPSDRHQKLKSLLDDHPDCAECLFRTGESAYQRAAAGAGSFKPGITYLELLKAKCPDYHSDMYYYLGNMYYAQERFAEASEAFQHFLKFPSDDPARMSKDIDGETAKVERILPELAFYTDFYKDQRPLQPQVLRGVDTPFDEYLPMFSPDNELLFFTRINKYQAKGDRFPRDVEELTEASRADVKGDFSKGDALPPPFNTGDSYGGVTVSVNNKELFVTVCKPVSASYKNCDIYRTHYETHMDFGTGKQVYEWSPLTNLGPNVNTDDGWESQPSLSADGRTLYFATVRRDSRGTDIYASTRNDKGEWGQAEPLPAPVNTEGDEKAPFMHSDSHTLYFAARPPRDENGKEVLSAGHRGIGGYDIFYSRLNDDGTWSDPKNLGNPINTPQDEHGLIVSADGRTAYFASSRFHGVGGLDIYGSELPQEARPQNIIVVKGEVKDEAGKAVKDATISVTYMDTRRTEVLKVDPEDGRYATVVNLKAGSDVIVTVKKPDHVFDSRSFSMEDTARGGVAEVDMRLEKIEVGKSYRVNDIKYATNSAEIEGASRYILDELIDFLKENPTVRIEVQGHTDNVGDLQSNMVLSRDRAFTVVAYLEQHGIDAGRLVGKGYGPTMPIASNDTPQGRAENRRTAFVITSR
jgi:outer membrane protein OmpA-like peptidoglycan-associated protein